MSLPNLANLIGAGNEQYDTSRTKQGRALIFNHFLFSKNLKLKNRLNSGRDVQSFSNILIHFGYKVSCFQDYLFEDIKNELVNITKEDHNKENSIVIALFTYGKNGKLASRDQWYDICKLFELLSPENCPTLELKPKILFINANHDVKVDEAWTCIPHYRDFLVSYSTVPENVNESESGTVHINPLWKLIKTLEKGTSIKIIDVITLLNQILYLKSNVINNNYKPFITSTLTRKLELKLINKDVLTSLKSNSSSQKSELGNLIQACVNEWIERKIPLEYELRFPNHGKVVIFNNFVFDNRFDSREGSKNDIERLKNSLPKLGFDIDNIQIHNNLKKDAIINELRNLSKENLDCLFVVVLTFGGGRNLLAKDKRYKINELLEPFHNRSVTQFEKPSSLSGKPKIFLINACNTNYVPEQYRSVHRYSDFLFGFATCNKLCYMPNLKDGCWYIKAVCDAIDDAYDFPESELPPDFLDILTKVHQKFENIHEKMSENSNTPASQIPAYNSSLTRVLRFPYNSGTYPGSSQTLDVAGTSRMSRWLRRRFSLVRPKSMKVTTSE